MKVLAKHWRPESKIDNYANNPCHHASASDRCNNIKIVLLSYRFRGEGRHRCSCRPPGTLPVVDCSRHRGADISGRCDHDRSAKNAQLWVLDAVAEGRHYRIVRCIDSLADKKHARQSMTCPKCRTQRVETSTTGQRHQMMMLRNAK